MKKKVIKLVCGSIILGTITGCGLNNNTQLNDDSKLESKGNCTALECINKISVENSVEEINNIIGFEGELTDEKYNIYYWELSDDSGIEVSYYSGTTGTIEADIDRDIVANKDVDFSRYDELKTKINEGITYGEFISYIGNVEGTLIEKSSYSNKYVWVAEDGSYLNGSFSVSSGKCTFASGMIY